jgi:hypothetical protein
LFGLTFSCLFFSLKIGQTTFSKSSLKLKLRFLMKKNTIKGPTKVFEIGKSFAEFFVWNLL